MPRKKSAQNNSLNCVGGQRQSKESNPGPSVRRGPSGFHGTACPDGSRLGPRALLPHQSPRPGGSGGRQRQGSGFLGIHSSPHVSTAAPGPSGPQPAPCCCSSVAKACLTLLRPRALRKVFLLHLLRFLPPAAPPERAATRSIHRAWEGSREGYLQSIFFSIGSHF